MDMESHPNAIDLLASSSISLYGARAFALALGEASCFAYFEVGLMTIIRDWLAILHQRC